VDKKWRDLARLAKFYLADEADPSVKLFMYFVYILLNEFKTRTYTGVATNVEKRLKKHNDGKVLSNRPSQRSEDHGVVPQRSRAAIIFTL
jgi:hypothetical protein